MWRDYSIRYIKNNKVTSIFLAITAFISAALLSLIMVLFYNLWIDFVNRQVIKTGNRPQIGTPIVLAYAFVLVVACAALISMIHNAFEVSMNTRLHQLGILQSVGATPKQIRMFLLQEAFLLCSLPLAAGTVLGCGLCFGLIQLIKIVTDSARKYGDYAPRFEYNILVSVIAFLLSVITILISVWIPAKKISRITPLEAIYYGDEPPVKKMRHFRILSKLLGVEGELAGKSIYVRRKSLRTAAISLALSFVTFSGFLNLETVSGMSTQKTFFERYKDVWDIMLTIEEDNSSQLESIKNIKGVESCTAYRRTAAYTSISESMLSKALKDIGGPGSLSDAMKADDYGNYTVEVPIIVLDEDSYRQYLGSLDIAHQEGESIQAVLVNQIWDSLHSDRMNCKYIPYLNTKNIDSLELYKEIGQEKPVITLPSDKIVFTAKAPVLKEEYSNYSLVQIVSEDFYHQNMEKTIQSKEQFYNIMTKTEEHDAKVREQLEARWSGMKGFELESRLEKEASEGRMRWALKFVISCMALLLSGIGLANVFSSTLGQIFQRKKEFARYLSAGVSPKGIKKILSMETLIISLRPVILGIVINVPIVYLALKASLLPASDFFAQMPVLPILLFTIFIVLSISLAYYLGFRKICGDSMIDILKDETEI